MNKYPEKYENLLILYNNTWHRGYWNGSIYTLASEGYANSGSLIIVFPEKIQEWKYESILSRKGTQQCTPTTKTS